MIHSIPLKKSAFCLITSCFMNKSPFPRWLLCEWCRLAYNRLQNFCILLFMTPIIDVTIWSKILSSILITITVEVT